MNPDTLAKAYRAIGQGYYEAADVLLEAAGQPQSLLERIEAAPVAPRAAQAAPDAMPEFPPSEYEDVPLPATAPGLGRCPFHGLAWSVKAAGVSKAGKPYKSFYHCDGKEPDGSFCQRKPTKGWADAHPIAA